MWVVKQIPLIGQTTRQALLEMAAETPISVALNLCQKDIPPNIFARKIRLLAVILSCSFQESNK
jgi:hypothetical protein